MIQSHELKEDTYQVTHQVGPHQDGIRLDQFLKERYTRRSRVQLRRSIESGAVTLTRASPHASVGKIKASTPLLHGDEVFVLSTKKPEPPVDFNYKILFEDEVLFVIEKPANLPVHPAGRYFFNTLFIHLKTEGLRNPLKANRDYYLAHRIDKETSGILVLAKDRAVCTSLTRQFAARTTEKRYYAITRGVPTQSEFEVNLPMARAKNSKISLKMAPLDVEHGGQTALTRFKVLESRGDIAWVECHPKTGRQHQIRVHLEHAGFPIVGDKLYGLPETEALRFFDRQNLTPEAEAKLLLPRHALHSAGIRFDHPLTHKRLEFKSELPPDLKSFFYSLPL